MSDWQNFFEKLYPTEMRADALRQPAAAAMAALLGSGAYEGGKLIRCRRGNAAFPDACLLLVDVEVGLGQRRVVNDVRAVERMAFVYTRPDVGGGQNPRIDGAGLLPVFYD